MSAIRSLDQTPFDQLAGVLVDEALSRHSRCARSSRHRAKNSETRGRAWT